MSDPGMSLDWSDPLLLGLIGGGVLVVVLLLAVLSAARRAGRAAEPLTAQVVALAQGQQQLIGGLTQVTNAQVQAQAKLLETMEKRLEEVSIRMATSLTGSATRTAHSLGELQQRLEAIDKAQTKIEKLSGEVLTLQDILSNKQTRGAFGEFQLQEIVSHALPPDAYTFQYTLSNGRRADCLIHLPLPPGPIVIDSKFPLEAYEALRAAEGERAKLEAGRALKVAVLTHVKHIAERYIIEGETAESALLFLPSEAVYAELHANFADVVRAGFEARVWIVSPTTAMATLNTMRAVMKDARMRDQAHRIRREMGLLTKDVARLLERVGNLDRHFERAHEDIRKIKISAERAGNRAERLEVFEFDDAPEAVAPPAAPALEGPD